ncbi:IS30 family transposase, partial [mine drainage metagenome]
ERGVNENTNGLLQRYFPKGTGFSTVSRRPIQWVQNRMNGRPRKVIGFRTPDEALNELLREELERAVFFSNLLKHGREAALLLDPLAPVGRAAPC